MILPDRCFTMSGMVHGGKVGSDFREKQLEEAISTPSPSLVSMMQRLQGDIMILGIGGKIGVTLGKTVLKAVRQSRVGRKVLGVSRFFNPAVRTGLEEYGIQTLQCDLLDPFAAALLPDAENVIFMAGDGNGEPVPAGRSWTINSVIPAHAASRFRDSRFVVFSSTSVYPPVSVDSTGSRETDPPEPGGEIAYAYLLRERIFQYFSALNHTSVSLLRLSHPVELRHGILREIGDAVYGGDPVDLSKGYVDLIWQGDAINQALLSLEHAASPPLVINLGGAKPFSIRSIALEFGRIFNHDVEFRGQESPTALLCSSILAGKMFGPPVVSVEQMILWISEWIKSGGGYLG